MAGYHRHAYYSDYYKRKSYVYRVYDAAGVLLYVGMALRPENRIVRHRATAWGGAIYDYTVEEFADREAAKAAERSAIHHEKPLHNLVRPRMECC